MYNLAIEKKLDPDDLFALIQLACSDIHLLVFKLVDDIIHYFEHTQSAKVRYDFRQYLFS